MIEYTKEQLDIIKGDYSDGDVIAVNAFAGAAKTTTVIGLCKEWQKTKKFTNALYLVYNTKMREEAERKMKKEGLEELVTVKTVHGLAYEYVGRRYRHKLGGNVTKTIVKNHFHCNWDDAEIVVEELKKFFNTSEPTMKGYHNLTKSFFRCMQDTNMRNVAMTHDGYLKLFSLCDDIKLDFDAILVDEAQDSNDVTQEIVMNKISSQGTVKIFVGDAYQQIYSFRGSKNIMSSVNANKRFPLSKSFRFGKNIADLSSQIIGAEVVGNETVDDKVHDCDVDINKGIYIQRTNSGVIKKGFELIDLGFKVHFLKGFSEYSMILYDICHMDMKRKDLVKNNLIKRFGDLKKYYNFCKNASDVMSITACELVLGFGPHAILEYLTRLKKEQVSINKADFGLATVHTVKGLEFKNVFIGDDFMPISELRNPRVVKRGKKLVNKQEEINLTYVAVTRAKHHLILNKDLSRDCIIPDIEFSMPKDSIWE